MKKGGDEINVGKGWTKLRKGVKDEDTKKIYSPLNSLGSPLG
jgi:hypothetical protein